MTDPFDLDVAVLHRAYAAFNARDLTAALATMAEDVTWPRAFQGDFVSGQDAVREYWTEQWSQIDPHVEPQAFKREDSGRILVEVHQVVRDLQGAVLNDQRVGHRFTIRDGLIRAMEVVSPGP